MTFPGPASGYILASTDSALHFVFIQPSFSRLCLYSTIISLSNIHIVPICFDFAVSWRIFVRLFADKTWHFKLEAGHRRGRAFHDSNSGSGPGPASWSLLPKCGFRRRLAPSYYFLCSFVYFFSVSFQHPLLLLLLLLPESLPPAFCMLALSCYFVFSSLYSVLSSDLFNYLTLIFSIVLLVLHCLACLVSNTAHPLQAQPYFLCCFFFVCGFSSFWVFVSSLAFFSSLSYSPFHCSHCLSARLPLCTVCASSWKEQNPEYNLNTAQRNKKTKAQTGEKGVTVTKKKSKKRKKRYDLHQER